MYEAVTFESILQRMLDRVPDNMDKREGSIIYDALAPAAVELQLLYIELDIILQESYADTATRDYLIRRAAERGLSPVPANKAILKAVATPMEVNIPIGSRFSLEDLNYTVIERMADGEWKVECDTPGTIGNGFFGRLIPIDNIKGLESIELTEVLIPGGDEEDTEVFRQRYMDSFDVTAYGGNIKDYLQKTNAIPGVGATKVTPVWNGGGTVRLTILGSDYSAASESLIETVQELIDPTQDGHGIGIAPIGHVVTVDTAEEIGINIGLHVTCQDGYTFSQLKPQIVSLMQDYMLELRKEWSGENQTVVRISQIESKIMSITGVLDITNTTINEEEENYVLTSYQIPVLGEITND